MGGALSGVGVEGSYRSSSTSAIGSANVGFLFFRPDIAAPLNEFFRARASSVRCIQHLLE